MQRSHRIRRKRQAIEEGKPVFNVQCTVHFVCRKGSYAVKTKTGVRQKRRSSVIQVRIHIGGFRSGTRSTGIPLSEPGDFDRLTLTLKNDPVGSTRLRTLRDDIRKVFNQRLMGNRTLNANLILDIALGTAEHDDESHYIMGHTKDGIPLRDRKIRPPVPATLEAITRYIAQKEKLLGNGLSVRSYNRYRQYGDILSEFVRQTYTAGCFLDDLTPAVEYDLLAYLKGRKGYRHNYAIKTMQFFKAMLTFAHAHGWVDRNVMGAVRLTRQKKEVRTLTMADLDALGSRHFGEVSLAQVRDVFLFCCYTGLAYTDVAGLSAAHIREIDGVDCIIKERNKSGVTSFIPLFPEAVAILNRYADHAGCRLKGVLLPVISNAKTNAHLKEIGRLAGVSEVLHMHLARKTFTMFVEERGFNVDQMAVMLGHTRATMTEQFYHKKRQAPVLRVFKELYSTRPVRRVAG